MNCCLSLNSQNPLRTSGNPGGFQRIYSYNPSYNVLKYSYIMDIHTAKQIRIEDFLHNLGYGPVKRQGINLWYRSPLREEKDASFKVNTGLNCWYDFDAPI